MKWRPTRCRLSGRRWRRSEFAFAINRSTVKRVADFVIVINVARPFAEAVTRLPREDLEKFLGALLLLSDIAAKRASTLPVTLSPTNDGAPATDTAQETATASGSSTEPSLQLDGWIYTQEEAEVSSGAVTKKFAQEIRMHLLQIAWSQDRV